MQKPGDQAGEIVGLSSFSIPLIAASYMLGNCTDFNGVMALDLTCRMGSVEIGRAR
jgi:hypothetical protein